MRSARLLAVAVLTVVLALSSAQNAFAVGVSITPGCGPPGTQVTIVVSGVTGFPSVIELPQLFLVPGWSCTGPLLGTLTCTTTVLSNAATGLYTLTVSIGMVDSIVESASTTFYVGNCHAVGGVVVPVNTFAVLGPWIAVIGLAGCVATVVVVAGKRRE